VDAAKRKSLGAGGSPDAPARVDRDVLMINRVDGMLCTMPGFVAFGFIVFHVNAASSGN